MSHFTFTPPLTAVSDLQNEACFIFPIDTEGNIYRRDGKIKVKPDEGVLMKCGTYVNKWSTIADKNVAEVVIIRISPRVIEAISESRAFELVKSKTASLKTSATINLTILMQKYLDSLFFYFDNPSLVHDALVSLKVEELTMLLLNSDEPNPVIELISHLFETEKYDLKKVVDANVLENLSLDELASLCNMSTPSFKRKFKALIGSPPAQYIKQRKLAQAAKMLKGTDKTVATIAYDCGFESPNYFSKSFHKEYGYSPIQYRHG